MSTDFTSSTSSAIVYQSLYLANLLLLPGIAFFILIWLLCFGEKQRHWTKIHLIRAIQISVIALVFIVIIPLIIIWFSPEFEASLMVMIFYFVTLHAGFVLIGMLNLSRAMVKKLPIF